MVRHAHKGERPRIIFGLIFFILIALATLAWATGVHTPNLPKPPLRELAARHNIEIGSKLAPSQLDNKAYANILSGQFSLISADGSWIANSSVLRPSAGGYDFKALDKAVAYARTHHMAVQVNSLIWGEQYYLPKWLKNGNYDQEQLLGLLDQHVITLVGHYKGKVKETVD